jgi:hypothetical protein
VEDVFNLLYGIDVAVNFFLCYYNEKGVMITDRHQIAKNYLTGFFFMDFVSSIPFQLLSNGGGGGKLLKILKLPKLTRMIRLVKIRK